MNRLLLPLFLLMLTTPCSGADDADDIIRQLARPAPATIAFTEVRISPLLREPLIVSGELGYDGPASLDRRVLRPYREHTAIRGESVRVEREGEPARSFALKRAPELRGVLSSFTALLTGDGEALRRTFTIDAQTRDHDGWSIQMTPLDARTRKRVSRLTAVGRLREPRCFTLTNTDGGASVMLLGAAADLELPKDVTLTWLQRQCVEQGR